MDPVAKARVTVMFITAATAGLALAVGDSVPNDLWFAAKTFGPILFGAALSQWLLFPLFSRRPGGLGWLLDGLAYVAVIALSGLLAGTLLMPGVGTVLGPIIALSFPTQSVPAALIYLTGSITVITLIRKAKARH
ncbi:MAG: hypothetical protein ACK4MS_04540 [Paracoccaceae bacterium]